MVIFVSGDEFVFTQLRGSKLNILKLRQVTDKAAISRSSLYAKVKQGKFPAPVKLGERASGWIEDEIDAWIEQRIQARQRGHTQSSLD